MNTKFSILLTLFFLIQLTNTEAQKLVESFEMPTPIALPEIDMIRVDKNDKMLLAGSFDFYDDEIINNHLIKLNKDGSLDENFNFKNSKNFLELEFLNSGEIIGLDSDSLYKIDQTGNIIRSAGIGASSNFSDIGIMENHIYLVAGNLGLKKYDENLNLELSFKNDNYFGGFPIVSSIAFQNGHVLVGGSFNEVNGVTKNDIARFSIDGVLDESFEIGSGLATSTSEMVIQEDGKIILSGFFQKSVSGKSFQGIVRLNEDGSIDNDFNPPKLGNGNNYNKVKLQEDKIIVSTYSNGIFSSANRLIRLENNGTIDSTFNIIEAEFPEISLTTSNEIISYSPDYISDNYRTIHKYNQEGLLIKTFTPPISKIGYFNNAKYYDDFLIVTGDFYKLNETETFQVGKMDLNGNIDTEFKVSMATNTNGTKSHLPIETKIRGENEIYISLIDALIKIDSKGSLVPEFKTPERLSDGNGISDSLFAVNFEFSKNNKIITQGYNGVYLLNSDGSQDLSFKAVQNNPTTIVKLGVQSTGKIIISERVDNKDGTFFNCLIRFHLDGQVDSLFHIGTGTQFPIWSLVVMPKDELLINTSIGGGYDGFKNDLNNFKLNPNGKINEEYNANLKKTFQSDQFPFFNKGVIYGNNSLLFTYSSSGEQLVAKIDSSGNLSSDFKIPSEIITYDHLLLPVSVGKNKFLLLGEFNIVSKEKKTKGLLFSDNSIPVITGTDSLFSINEDHTIVLTPSDFIINDPDNSFPEDFKLKILEGENFSSSQNKVIPDTNFNGSLKVSVIVNDGTDDSEPFQISIDVRPVNDIPVIVGTDSTYTTQEETPIIISLSDLKIKDPDSNFPEEFSLKIMEGENYTVSSNEVIPDPDFNGTLTGTIKVNDGTDDSEPFQISIEVRPVNDIPVILGTDSTYTTQEETPVMISISDLKIKDPDSNFPEEFSLKIMEGENYTVSGNEVIPDPDFNGALTVSIKVNDNIDDSEPFQVLIEVLEVLGLNNNYISNNYLIYPNPVEHQLYIKQTNTSNSYLLKIYDMAGILIYSSEKALNQDQELNLDFLQKGIYFLKLGSGKYSGIKKIIKF